MILDETQKVQLYIQYRDDLREEGVPDEEIVQPSSFYSIWKDEYGHVQLNKKKTIDSKCTVCEDLKVGTRTPVYQSLHD